MQVTLGIPGQGIEISHAANANHAKVKAVAGVLV
jgi:hypothetical protein